MNVGFGTDGRADGPEVDVVQRPVADFADARLLLFVFSTVMSLSAGVSPKPVMGVKTDSPPDCSSRLKIKSLPVTSTMPLRSFLVCGANVKETR